MSFRWLPNAISVLRILLVVPIAWLIVDGQYDWALILFFVAGISDAIDGYLARKFAWQSPMGALLDPLADKLLVLASFTSIWIAGLIPLWLAALIIFRDAIIICGATVYHFRIKPVEGDPTLISKLNTTLQIVLVLTVLSRSAYGWPASEVVLLAGAAVFVTVAISGFDYVWTWSMKARSDK
jgi:cardiolipin synthase